MRKQASAELQKKRSICGWNDCAIKRKEQIEVCGGMDEMILLVIDMQKGLVDEDLYAFDTFADRTVRLVDAA